MSFLAHTDWKLDPTSICHPLPRTRRRLTVSQDIVAGCDMCFGVLQLEARRTSISFALSSAAWPKRIGCPAIVRYSARILIPRNSTSILRGERTLVPPRLASWLPHSDRMLKWHIWSFVNAYLPESRDSRTFLETQLDSTSDVRLLSSEHVEQFPGVDAQRAFRAASAL